MKPTSHASTNTTLVAPEGWDEQADDECLDLPITASEGVLFSYWKPTLRERLAIFFGGHIRLGIFGNGHPPVSLDTL